MDSAHGQWHGVVRFAHCDFNDRVRYEALAKAIIFLPMAISFVGAGVIWKFVYDYGTGQAQIGLLNGIVTALGGQPISWLTTPQLIRLL